MFVNCFRNLSVLTRKLENPFVGTQKTESHPFVIVPHNVISIVLKTSLQLILLGGRGAFLKHPPHPRDSRIFQ